MDKRRARLDASRLNRRERNDEGKRNGRSAAAAEKQARKNKRQRWARCRSGR
jgi:hypothetical protein